MDLTRPVTDLKGVGDKTGELFGACGVRSVGELLRYYPKSYESFGEALPVRALREGEVCAVACRLLRVPALKVAGRYRILAAEATDGTDALSVTWFNQPYLRNSLCPGRSYVLRGHVQRKGAGLVLEQPAIYAPQDYAALAGRLLPRYHLVKGLKNKAVEKAVRQALALVPQLLDPLPGEIRERRGLPSLPEALQGIHFPQSGEARDQARRRLVYEEFFLFLVGVRILKASQEDAGIPMEAPPSLPRLLEALPWELTGGQRRVLDELLGDMTRGRRMHRLIQGDVGSGKTILALLAMLVAVENGYQAALMAPTQVLAAQHQESFARMAEQYRLPLRPLLLSGTLGAAERRRALEAVERGEANCVIGTHALMQDRVRFHRLGLVVTDEQHRFGARQRGLLAEKGELPHILVMSATPIPRTLAMILYGDLQISRLTELPAGRKRIRNAVVDPTYRPKAWRFIADEVAKGRQAYVICPMVEESEDGEEGAFPGENVTDYAEKLREAFPSTVRIGILHGRLRPEEKEERMGAFAAGALDVLVSTTVVEVGVNVPNATVILIENAERFGLATLHQLRGRVGRGREQSYCILMNTSRSEEARKRLEILQRSNDGFEIADKDLEMRGPGDIFGVRQSGGPEFYLADIYGDAELLREASEDADALLREDPCLEAAGHEELRRLVEREAHLDVRTL